MEAAELSDQAAHAHMAGDVRKAIELLIAATYCARTESGRAVLIERIAELRQELTH